MMMSSATLEQQLSALSSRVQSHPAARFFGANNRDQIAVRIENIGNVCTSLLGILKYNKFGFEFQRHLQQVANESQLLLQAPNDSLKLNLWCIANAKMLRIVFKALHKQLPQEKKPATLSVHEQRCAIFLNRPSHSSMDEPPTSEQVTIKVG